MSAKILRDSIVDKVIFIEGGYADDPLDSGGKTKYGVTERVARRSGYKGHMKNLSLAQAKKIYINKYWNRMYLDGVAEIAPRVAEELFDSAGNMGTGRAGRFLQRALNVFNSRGHLIVDGKIGPATIRALTKFINKRGHYGDIVLTRALNSLQGAFYISLAERRVKDKRFIYGWFKHRVK